MKPARSDQSVAIYGLLAIAAIALIGYVVLLVLDRDAPESLMISVVLGIVSGVLGWSRGGTYYAPDTETIPTAPVTHDQEAPHDPRS